jgi:bla regulator protein BlaR1
MMSQLTNHLWQSTLFAVVAGVLTIAFRANRAQIRYWLWFSASLKFFIPFSLLMTFGSQLEWAPAAKKIARQAVSSTMVQIAQPFPDNLSFVPAKHDATDWIPIILLGVWACGFGTIALVRLRGWLRIRAAVRSSVLLEFPAKIEVRVSPGLLEPGVVGLLRPILLFPAGIVERLTPRQLEAVLAHEFCHVRRRDNLTAAMHMLVEAIFWFHPLVWWIGARLVVERERACDEDVLRLGSEPHVYAEAILSVCKHYLESPLVCVSGITGSDLKKRINAIMARRIVKNLNLPRKLLLVAGGIAAMLIPIAIGFVGAPASRAQSNEKGLRFEVASIKPSNSADRRPLFRVEPGGFTAANATVKRLIEMAYRIKLFQISGGPGWIDSELFDISAKPESSADMKHFDLMLQGLLADRFQLVIRRDNKDMPVYALVTGKTGPKFKESKESDPNIIDLGGVENPATARPGRLAVTKIRRGLLVAQEATMAGFASQVSEFLAHPVIDKTKLTGKYDLKLEWQPDENQVATFQAMQVPEGFGAPPADPAGPSLFAALQEQLGLKLESEKGPVEIFNIERIEWPSAH